MNKYSHIQEEAFKANMQLNELKLVMFTFGNVSAADRSLGVFAIKPSGVAYSQLTPEKIVVVDFDGKKVEGKLNPSSDTLTHAVLYRHWNEVNGIAHTHSLHATAWAQSQKDIPVFGTTHADHTTYDIPCAAPMSDEKIKGNYELETGFQIIEELKLRGLNYKEMEMILVGNHAPFTWGENAAKAVFNSALLEYLAHMALMTRQINPDASRMKDSLISKHYERKHGAKSYYGQGGSD